MSSRQPKKLIQPLAGNYGILGGTFDPVHLGHLNLARQVFLSRELDGILFVTSIKPPFKPDTCQAAFSSRVEMVELMIEADSKFIASSIEEDGNLSGYALETIRALKAQSPDASFSFLIGSDILAELTDWYKSEELFKETKFIVGTRTANASNAVKHGKVYPKLDYLEMERFDCSSSDIRKRIRAGIDEAELAKLVGTKVAAYIRKHQLYK